MRPSFRRTDTHTRTVRLQERSGAAMATQAVCLCSLLVQALSQVFDALVHHSHLGVPLVQQLLVLGQFVALLQVEAVPSLRSPMDKPGQGCALETAGTRRTSD